MHVWKAPDTQYICLWVSPVLQAHSKLTVQMTSAERMMPMGALQPHSPKLKGILQHLRTRFVEEKNSGDASLSLLQNINWKFLPDSA